MTTLCLIDTNVLIDYLGGSALVKGVPLMTRNAADFKSIPGLTMLDPSHNNDKP